jgi:hypothetical protein
MRFFAWFLKSHWKGQLQLPTTEPASKHKKAFEKTLQTLLRKDLPTYTPASNNR